MSDDSVVISSFGGSAELRLSEGEGLVLAPGFAYFRATLRKTDIVGTHTQVTASTKIPAYGPHGELTRFFEGLAANRDGWEGEKRWESVGGVLTLGVGYALLKSLPVGRRRRSGLRRNSSRAWRTGG